MLDLMISFPGQVGISLPTTEYNESVLEDIRTISVSRSSFNDQDFEDSGVDINSDSLPESEDESVNGNYIPGSLSNSSNTLRLPSGKTISHRSAASPRAMQHRRMRNHSPNTSVRPQTQKKLQGNCAMISASSSSTASATQRTTDVSEKEASNESLELQSSQPPHQSLRLSNRNLVKARNTGTTVRGSDAQMLASLPLSTQNALLATQQKAVSQANRAEQRFRGKMDSQGNVKVMERFVNDVPGGRSHRCRYAIK